MPVFKFKEFDVEQEGCAQKVGTDSMVLGAFVDYPNPKNVLDIGTGNGTLALMMAQKFKNASIKGVEVQKSCYEVAKKNFAKASYKDRLSVLNANINDCKYFEEFDLIISNPPFFENAMAPARHDRAMARHQSTLTLTSLIRIAADSLVVNGELWIIIPKESSGDLITQSLEVGLKLSRRINVFGKPNLHKRDILVFMKTSKTLTFSESDFTIRNADGYYTEEYKAKTIDFHYSAL